MILFDAKPPRDAAFPGGHGLPFDWRLLEGVALDRALAARRRAACRKRGGGRRADQGADRRCVVRCREPARGQGPGQARQPSSRPWAAPMRILRDDDAQQPAQRPGRAWPVRHPWRPLRRRDADAADPGARAGLRGCQARSHLRRRAAGLVQGLCRPAVAALFRRAADRPSRRRQDLLQARRAQPHRRAQDQQRAGPDDAGPADGQEADHRRDRRRPARRGDRDRGRALRPGMHRLHGRARHRAAAAQRVPHEAARAPRSGR